MTSTTTPSSCSSKQELYRYWPEIENRLFA